MLNVLEFTSGRGPCVPGSWSEKAFWRRWALAGPKRWAEWFLGIGWGRKMLQLSQAPVCLDHHRTPPNCCLPPGEGAVGRILSSSLTFQGSGNQSAVQPASKPCLSKSEPQHESSTGNMGLEGPYWLLRESPDLWGWGGQGPGQRCGAPYA